MIESTAIYIGMLTKKAGKKNMNYNDAFKRAVATFVFAVTGVLVGGALGTVPVWESALWAGVGALVNFVYRAAESYLGKTDQGE